MPQAAPQPSSSRATLPHWRGLSLKRQPFGPLHIAARTGNPDQTCRGESMQRTLRISQIPITKHQCCMEFLPRQSAHFLHRMHTAHASTGIEPIPHQCLTVLANRQADYQTALPAWFLICCALRVCNALRA
jgi:hypothetical protein